MIRRLLCKVADWLADTAWLREMRAREVQATQSALRHERSLQVDGLATRAHVPEGSDG